MVDKNPDTEFQNFLSKVAEYNDNKKELEDIKKAWDFAKLAHVDQKRLSGEAYVLHPLATANMLAGWKLDKTTLVAALLHDTIEDGGAKREDIVKDFGEEVAVLVDGVTKVTEIRLTGSRENQFVENLRKMLLVMAKDLRVVLVKLADRYHNMKTLDALPPAKQEENSRETLEIYAPLAERLGIGELKGQLEDLAFPYVYPEEYKKVIELSKDQYKKAEKHINKMKKTLLKKLKAEKINAEINGRKKHIYSLWNKLSRSDIDWDFDKINDIVALRILVDTISECYATLGIVHATYKPVPLIGVSDFIAQPKPNGYRSIHTKVFGPGRKISEVQIRTKRMHAEAENGVAAHWAYALAKSKGAKDEVLEKKGVSVGKERLGWVKQLLEWQNQITDSEEFLKAVKFDAFSHRNFVFSPNGDVYDLPRGATPVDFAFAVHTDLVNYIKGAKVNGKIVPLNYKLKSGEVVEIIKNKEKRKPSPDWLNFVVTTVARRNLKKILN